MKVLKSLWPHFDLPIKGCTTMTELRCRTLGTVMSSSVLKPFADGARLQFFRKNTNSREEALTQIVNDEALVANLQFMKYEVVGLNTTATREELLLTSFLAPIFRMR
jgi:hypothetical protein